MAQIMELETIREGDSLVAEWITSHGFEIVPVKVTEIAGDILVFNHGDYAKRKRAYGIQWRCWDSMPEQEDRDREEKLSVKSLE